MCQYFPPEIGAPQARLSELARLWAEAGDEVTVLTGMPNHPTGVVPQEYKGKLLVEEHTDGYRVVRTWLYATPNERIFKKTLAHLSFMISSLALGARRAGGFDVVVVSSPAFFSILSAWALARLRRRRLVVEIRDLWPAIFVELGVLTNPWVIRALEHMELAAYRAADAVVVVSEGFRADLIGRGVPPDKVHTIPNGVDLDRFSPQAIDVAGTRAQLGASDGLALVLYAGAHGASHGLPALAEAAARLAGDPVHVAFVGEGSAKAQLRQRVDDLGLRNVSLHAGVARSEVPRLVQAADICLVPLRDVPLFSTFIPSKIFEYLAGEKPVVGSVRGESAQILRDAGAVVVEPEDSVAIADAIRDLAAHPERWAAMGRRGRRYVSDHFDRRQLADRYRSLLLSLTGGL